ncbi:hypothetical protein [Dictyobacter formicarum]|uniref:Uncharacterized protein n=1 Tax=Dictyobacter formicarum TaxID=2778368 RepID=A0ABQ3V945_9CHLR|nr:hypothetical protein [Dictyobacter formicarum]GHO82305.1 hypothetical protein KSZ_03110 [Dictyobacter formicarum]
MDQQTYIINFDNISGAEANIYASELRDVLLDTSSDIEVESRRDNPHTQDFGATLVLILGTPAILATAKAVGDWLTLRRKTGIIIKTADGEIVATNLTSKDALKLAELLVAKK